MLNGTTGNGIYARNSSAGTALSVTTAAGTTGVSGSSNGINARNYGTGALTITANGDVTGTTGFGIYARNLNVTGGANVTVTTAAGTAVSGTTGIFALNFGTGALTVTANGDVTGTCRVRHRRAEHQCQQHHCQRDHRHGIDGVAAAYSGFIRATVARARSLFQSSGTVTGNTAGISAVTAATVTVAGTGTVNGGPAAPSCSTRRAPSPTASNW